jgi:hypothetical protein
VVFYKIERLGCAMRICGYGESKSFVPSCMLAYADVVTAASRQDFGRYDCGPGRTSSLGEDLGKWIGNR